MLLPNENTLRKPHNKKLEIVIGVPKAL